MKKTLTVLLIGTMLIFTVSGCGDKAQTETTPEVSTEVSTETSTEVTTEGTTETSTEIAAENATESASEVTSEENGYAIIKENIKVGQYKGISVNGQASSASESQNETDNVENIKNDLFITVINNSELGTYSEDELNRYIEYANEYYAEYADYLGVDFNTYITDNLGLETEDQYKEFVEDEAKQNLLREYVIRAISEEEGVTIADEEIDAEINNYIEQGSFATEAEVLDYITKDEMALNLKYYKILDIIYDNANIVSDDSTANN